MSAKGNGGGDAGYRSEAGFTLIEVVVALFIVALSMTAIFASFNSWSPSSSWPSR